MRGLFITQGLGVGLYGAAKSIQLLLKNLPYNEFDLVVTKGIFKKNDIAFIKSLVGDKVKNIYELSIQGAVDACALGTEVNGNYNKLKTKIFKIIWDYRDRKNLNEIIKRNNYDFIHINFVGYHQLVSEKLPIFIHVRDLVYQNIDGVAASLKKAKGVFFIDEGVYRPFKNYDINNYIILNNPFDMHSPSFPLNEYQGVKELSNQIDISKATVFAVIGKFREEKGVRFIIEAFKQTSSKNILLLIVGEGTNSEDYYQSCKKSAAEDKRILWYGEEKNMEYIYGITDYVVRGEPKLLIGRTIYEGLYSGCGVILPISNMDNIENVFEFEDFKDKIKTYKSRNLNDLSKLFDSLALFRMINRRYKSNVHEYIQSFSFFIKKKLDKSI